MVCIKIEIAEKGEQVNVKLVNPKNIDKASNNEKLVASQVSNIINEALKNLGKN